MGGYAGEEVKAEAGAVGACWGCWTGEGEEGGGGAWQWGACRAWPMGREDTEVAVRSKGGEKGEGEGRG